MAGQRDIHRMRDLRREAVMFQGGDQADYRTRYPDRDGDQVGAGERWGGREPVDATAHLFKLAAIPKVVQRPRVNAQTNGVAGAEHSFMFGEHMACLNQTTALLNFAAVAIFLLPGLLAPRNRANLFHSPTFCQSFTNRFNYFRASRPGNPILACYTGIRRNQCAIPSLPSSPSPGGAFPAPSPAVVSD